MSAEHLRAATARLRDQRQRILQLWEGRIRAALPQAGPRDTPALLDSMPDLLDQLGEALSSAPDQREVQKHARAHARERSELELEVGQLIFEYEVLRQVVLEVLDEPEPLAVDGRDRLFDFVLRAVRDVVGEFTRVRDQQREEAQAELRRANDELGRRVEERVRELQLSEVRFRDMVEAVKDYAIFTLDPEGNITTWNAGCVRMKQYSVEEAVGHHFSMLYPREANRRDEPGAHLRSATIEGRFRGEGIRVRKNGDHFLADVSITPIYADTKLVGFTKVVQDLTERNLLMQERDLSRSQAARMQLEAEVRDRFVATLTHDLRSPLAAAKTAAAVMARSPGDAEHVRRWAEKITVAVERTDTLISDLLDASRVSAGAPLPVKFERCDAARIATAVCEGLAVVHGHRFVVEREGQSVGWWDPAGLRRILENLLSNAVKYGEPDHPITVRVREVEERLLLSVHNFGTIIPVEEQENLFRPFHRTRLAEASGQTGWGLGLTLVEGIVEAHRGIVKVESYPKEGTTFTVDLPMDSRDPKQEPAFPAD